MEAWEGGGKGDGEGRMGEDHLHQTSRLMGPKRL